MWSFPRESMTADQLAAIESLTLQPLPTGDACGADGYDVFTATVTDRDGTTATYKDTGCPYLMIAGASAILPNGFFRFKFPLGDSQPCQ